METAGKVRDEILIIKLTQFNFIINVVFHKQN